MSYPSVDLLQKTLMESVFHNRTDAKKAAGRALGTLVEIITFYLLRSWEFRDALAIERPLPEFANSEITHNVEYSLHPVLEQSLYSFPLKRLPLTTAKIRESMGETIGGKMEDHKSNELLSSRRVLRNACTLASSETELFLAHLDRYDESDCHFSVAKLHPHPYAIFECKRVGIEEGMKKGPQTIEKAKQGAYVARVVSGLQKIRLVDGSLVGVIEKEDQTIEARPYKELLREIIETDNSKFLRSFILTVGIVSNHGNWFTQETQNKEIKVLAQSYDWLLFLEDRGLADFIQELLIDPKPEYEPVKNAFMKSYEGEKRQNCFTKVLMDALADDALKLYFRTHRDRVALWFNVLTPRDSSLDLLKQDLTRLKTKNWKEVWNDDSGTHRQ